MLVVCVGLAGCGSDDTKNRLKTVPVSGTVTLDGEVFGPGTLSFTPQSAGERMRMAIGKVDASGNFVAGSYEEDDGIVPGEYLVKGQEDTAIDPSAALKTTPGVKVKIGEEGEPNLEIALKGSENKTGGDLMNRKLGPSMKMVKP
jgi:hypothetical protein